MSGKFLIRVVATASVALGVSSCARASEAWTAFPDSNQPAVQISKTANDGKTVFLGGCNKRLGPGLTGTFSSYRGNALRKVDDQSEPVVFEIKGKDAPERFTGQVHYYGAESSWVITGLLPPAFVDAFSRGDMLTVRNARGQEAFSFDLLGSAKAAKTMQQVCGMASSAAASASGSQAPASPRDKWTATSTTAMAITGDIRISPKQIRFETGATLELATTDRPGVMRVAKRENPILKNGNRLCGQEPPTFLVFAREKGLESLDSSSSLHLKVYNGPDIPPASDAIGMENSGRGFCALYNYSR